jgi:hypothetical protein
MLHAKGLVTVIAYDMYLEAAEGNLDEEWHLQDKKIVSFYRFRGKLSKQMLEYDPRNRKYAGDEKFRVSTKQTVHQRILPKSPGPAGMCPRTPRSTASVASSSTSGVTADDIKSASKRLCGDLSQFGHHVASVVHLPLQNKRICVVCGKPCRYVCKICDKAMHYPSFTKKDEVPKQCFLNYHNTNFFGLAMEDHKLVGKKRKEFEIPTDQRIQEHHVAMQRMRSQPFSPLPTPDTRNTSTATPDRLYTPQANNRRTAQANSRKETRAGSKATRGQLQRREDGWNDNCL